MQDRPAAPARAEEPLPEGVEQAPPGTRTMALVRWSLVGVMALAAVGAWSWHAASSGVLSRAEARFHCPMHPSVVMDRKGECPICGMDLVPIAGDGKAAAAHGTEHAAHAGGAAPAVEYTCPMHPAFVTKDAAARCPDCGMKLVAKPPAAAVVEYTCPMHPAFVTPDAAARCPDCGMKLVAKALPAAPVGVPGLAPVDLSVDRVQLMGMRTAAATNEVLAPTIRTVGFVAPNEAGLVSVTTRFSGWVESLAVGQTGQLVEKGQVLATVYSPDLANAQQVFLNAIKWSDRKGAGGAVSPGTSDLERDARQRLELLGIAREDIDAIAQGGQAQQAVNVRSPVRGYVARKSVLRGLYVQPGTELFQLADLSNVWVLADVYESEIARVKVGQKATLELASWPGERFEGRVTFIYPALNSGSRTLQARLEFRNPGLKLRPGMYGDVTLEAGATRAVVIPREALVDTGETQYVFVARGQGRFEPRRVRVGWSGAGKVAVLEGLADGERVVTTANFVLDSESRLRAAIEGTGGDAGVR